MHNLMLMRKYAVEAEKEICEELERMEKVLENAPPGRLVVANNKKGTSYYVCEEGSGGKRRTYIGKGNVGLISSLGDKLFAKTALKELKKLLKIVMKINKNHFSLLDLADNFAEKNILTSEDTVLPRKVFNENWSNEKFVPLGEVDGKGYEITAMCGLPVRSKSEATIADVLHGMKVPFKYEEKHIHKNGKICYPDFKIIHPVTGDIIIYEHFGRMDDSDYVNKNIWRLDDFVEDGFILGKTLVFSFETKKHPLSPLYVKRKLEELLLGD